jgi:hypothetical protein
MSKTVTILPAFQHDEEQDTKKKKKKKKTLPVLCVWVGNVISYPEGRM